MSSPITSVSDPSENPALASMITQVQPGQTPVVVRGARPAKPAAKKASSSDPARRKKKTRPETETTAAVMVNQSTQDQAVAEAARLGAQAASSQSQAASVGTNATVAQSLEAGQASSTVMASTTDAPSASIVPVEATEKPATQGTAPASARTQAATTAKKAVSAPSSSTASGSKTSASAPPKNSATRTASPSFGRRLLAMLTCSSASSDMVRSEMQEKQTTVPSKQTGSTSAAPPTAAAVAHSPGVPPPNSDVKAASQEEYPTTPGGGTQLPKEETGDVMSGAVVPPGSAFVTPQDAIKTRPSTSSLSEDETEDEEDELDPEDEYLTDDQTEEHRLIMQGGIGIPLDEFGNPHPLLPAVGEPDRGRKCLVLDLDETLVHSSFKMIQNADFIVPVEIDGTVHNVYVIKRPGVDEFMRLMGEIYEVVVFTASLSKYADPVLDILDIHNAVRHRLFRESCYNHKGNYVKDLSQLGRDIADSIIIDNSPASYIFHPNNAVPISSWFNDPHDTELTDLCPFLADLAHVDDVRAVLDGAL